MVKMATRPRIYYSREEISWNYTEPMQVAVKLRYVVSSIDAVTGTGTIVKVTPIHPA